MNIYIVIAAYNEEKNIDNVLKYLSNLNYSIIVIDDGSEDKTSKIVKKYSVILLKHIINRGQGASLVTGTKYAYNKGAILGAFVMTYLYSRKDFWKLVDIGTLGIAFAGIFVRLGNYFNNEIVGRVGSNGRYPVQLYESVMHFGISLSLFYLYVKKKLKIGSGMFFWYFIVVYSFIRFFLEFFKEYLVFSIGLTMGQRISIVFFVVGVVVLLRKRD